MKITYIGHSGFLVELDSVYLLFDCVASEEPNVHALSHGYQPGTMPQLNPEKQLVVFSSHSHGDHYNHAIWKLQEQYPNVLYVLDKRIGLSKGIRGRLGITDADLERVWRVRPNETYEITLARGQNLVVETLLSTDIGVAYLVTVEGKTIYHAGDLHLWRWDEEGPAYNDEMQKAFDENTKPLHGRTIDVGFFLLDYRLEGTAYLGMDAYLQMMDCKAAFPMHQWDHYELTDAYLEARADQEYVKVLRKITTLGESFFED